jgi:FkbM family methyltransferase
MAMASTSPENKCSRDRKFLHLLICALSTIKEKSEILKKSLILKNDNDLLNSYLDIVEEGNLVVRSPEFYGSFEMDFRSHILRRFLLKGNYEPEIVQIIKKVVDPKRDVIDIGANIGLFTTLFSKIISNNNKVLSIEPTPNALKYLYNNIKRNNLGDKVIVYEGVASNRKDNFKIKTIAGLEEYSSIGNLVHPAIKDLSAKEIMVKGDTIDNLVESSRLNPGLIKIDVEGAEYLVLMGAAKTLDLHKPIIISELSDNLLSSFGTNSLEVFNFLRKNEFEIFDAFNFREISENPFEGEFIAIPNSMKIGTYQIVHSYLESRRQKISLRYRSKLRSLIRK